jgi:hypothetical protein
MLKHLRHTIAGLLALAFALSLSARGQFWDFLGYTQIDRSQDHVLIQITRRDVHFRTIQLRVSGEALFFDRLVIHFEDGSSQELVVSDRILPGGSNYVIDLLGERSLETVELWYYKEHWRQNATVSVYGIHLPDPVAQANAPKHQIHSIGTLRQRDISDNEVTGREGDLTRALLHLKG